MKTYFISDTHFGHENIIKYCNRPFETVEEMNFKLIHNWNKTVGHDDIVYVLGDFAFGNKDKIANYAHQLNGRKMLICGNHDPYKPTQYMELGFEWATRFPIIYDKFWMLSHEPMFLEFNSPYFNLHGHIHQNEYRSGPKDSNHHFNCSVEQIDYKPITFRDIKKRIGLPEEEVENYSNIECQ